MQTRGGEGRIKGFGEDIFGRTIKGGAGGEERSVSVAEDVGGSIGARGISGGSGRGRRAV